MILKSHHYATHQPIELSFADGSHEVVYTDWVAPSLFDIQINGALQRSFNSPTLSVDDVRVVTEECRRHGIGLYCPTLVTTHPDAIEHGLHTLERARDEDEQLRTAIPGYHVEGPFIAPEDGPRGAHPLEHVRDPDWDLFRRWQDAARGRIRIVTLAPERPGAIRFIEKLTESGVVVAIGHTAASAEAISAAIEVGAKMSTHLGNGAHSEIPRHPNYIWEQLAADNLIASLITDGHHLPASVVKCMLRVKSPRRVILTCDASSLAGCEPGRYREWGQEIDVTQNGKVVLAGTPYLAGSGVFTDVCVATLLRMTEVTLAEVIDMAAVRPRELLALPIPQFDVGEIASLVTFDWKQGSDVRNVMVVTGSVIDRLG